MSAITVGEIATAASRAAVTVAADPEVRHYSDDTIAKVFTSTITNLAGAGSLASAGKRIANDPALAAIPVDVVEAIMVVSFRHFARALAGRSA